MCYLEHQYSMASRILLYCTSNSFLMQYSACQQSHIVNVTQGNLENFQLNCSKVLIQMDGLRFNQESGTKVIVLHLFVLFIVHMYHYLSLICLKFDAMTVALQFIREGTLCNIYIKKDQTRENIVQQNTKKDSTQQLYLKWLIFTKMLQFQYVHSS